MLRNSVLKTIVVICASTVLVPAFSLSTNASTAEPADTSNSTSSADELPSVTVTARRVEENVQTVPVSVTVISPQALADNNVQTLADIQYLVPSLTVAGAGFKDGLSFNLRGQGGQNAPSVIAYVNEVPLPPSVLDSRVSGGPNLLFDMEDVQVL